MLFRPKWVFWIAVSAVCSAQDQREWSEAQIVERFLTLSPQAQELRARLALTEAEAKTRTVYPNPAVSYSREGAGYNEFFEASQTLPLNGRVRYLRDAGSAAVSVADANREAALWSLRSDLRLAFYQMVAAQDRVRLLSARSGEVEELIRILRQREQEGEGSRYDRLRAEREIAELRTDVVAANALIAEARGKISGFLPEGTQVQSVQGALAVSLEPPDVETLRARAIDTRADYRAEQKALTRFKLEEQAARRLRIPDPQVSAGVKRADVTSGVGTNPFSNVTRTGVVFSLSVPLPVFNSGRYEVARYQAEQQQATARAAVLARQIQTEIQGAREVLIIRGEALAAYQRELESAGAELIRITRVAYEEGEVGILELLDSLRVNRLASLRLLELQAGVREAFIELERVVGAELTTNGGGRP
ncbi:MAG: TolC family protein [Acidobacteriia bacterium]|nr:TolC family protein [Terriglobia bacterium]